MQDIRDLLIKFEGLVCEAYQDIVGLWTIGIGHLLTREEHESGKLHLPSGTIGWKQGITKSEALELLDVDCGRVRQSIEPMIKQELLPNQWNALVSFVFNIGIGAFRDSTLLRKLNSGQLSTIPEQMLRWTKAGNLTVPGLVARREAEIKLWNGQDV